MYSLTNKKLDTEELKHNLVLSNALNVLLVRVFF